MIPSVEYAAELLLTATATYFPFPYVTEYQLADDGNVAAVHVIPSVEYAAELLLIATATNFPLPYVTENQLELEGNVL